MTIYTSSALQDKHALITGATGGIGYQTAIVLASMGAKLTLTGRKKDKLQTLKQEILTQTPDATIFTYTTDITESANREALIQHAEQTLGPVSLLVNSAGTFIDSEVEQLSQEQLEKTMHLNYTVPILLSQQVYPAMKNQRYGVIINVSSLSGLRGTFGGTAYCGSKFALIGFTQSFALEAIQHGIRVNAVCPGFVETEMGHQAINEKAIRANRSFEEQYQLASEGLPSGRITTPEEVANTIAFLLTDAANNIIGESVKISGGSVMR